MSHIPQRKEKDCLNCGTVVQGRYCHECGQENVVPKETFWHMVTHFFNDITHFDGSFFTTVKDLFSKPGFLSKEYMAGRRVKYLHPVRMYVFTSAIFFLLFFSFFSTKDIVKINGTDEMSGVERLELIKRLETKYKNDATKKVELQQLQIYKDTLIPIPDKDNPLFYSDFVMLDFSGESKTYKSIAAYDSIQKDLAIDKRDNWIKQRLVKKEISINNKYRGKPSEVINKIGYEFLHKLPYLLFVSLPLFALILRLVYIRRKKYYFADHGVFTIHLYVFTFLLLLVGFLFDKLKDVTDWGILSFIIGALFIYFIIYLYKAMRRFYEQNRIKTILKLFLIFIFSLVMMLLLTVFFFFFTAFSL